MGLSMSPAKQKVKKNATQHFNTGAALYVGINQQLSQAANFYRDGIENCVSHFDKYLNLNYQYVENIQFEKIPFKQIQYLIDLF